MKRLWRGLRGASGVAGALLLGACAPFPTSDAPALESLNKNGTERAAEKPVVANAARDQTRIERVPFVLGVSSVTVERMALRATCTGGAGAGLLTPPGPVEVYRMACDDGKAFMARCELRQCKPM